MALFIRGVHLAYPSNSPLSKRLFDIKCENGIVKTIREHEDKEDKANGTDEANAESGELDGRGGLLLPSLCHAHIHLDKCFILEQGGPLPDSTFSTALKHTAGQKQHFPIDPFSHYPSSLHSRGSRLIRESVQAGVTAMRAHVEVDEVVGMACVEVGVKLKEEWKERCDVRLCVFMQEQLFCASQNTPSNDLTFHPNASQLDTALSSYPPGTFSAIGSAPYVEADTIRAHANIAHIFDLANKHGLHVDFHLDYDLGEDEGLDDEELGIGKGAMIWEVLECVKNGAMGKVSVYSPDEPRTVTIGHATRLTRFSQTALKRLRSLVASVPEPVRVYFVALPQSDVYMMGRLKDDAEYPMDKKRGTLDVVKLVRAYGIRTGTVVEHESCERSLNVAMSINNVQNAFTPQGSVDPLMLCPLGMMLYQAGSESDAKILLESITLTSHLSTGVSPSAVPNSLIPSPRDPANFVLLHGNDTLWGAALNPGYERTTVYAGKVVGWRRCSEGVIEGRT